MDAIVPITSRDNPLVKRLRALAGDPAAYRKAGEVWLEGDHLVRALLARGQMPRLIVFAESAWQRQPQVDPGPASVRRVVLADALMQQVSGLESAAGMGCVWPLPASSSIRSAAATVVLDRLQDPGNVGSVLRSAAAMGFEQVLAVKGTAALWSPKVLRAGMGAHFGLSLVEGVAPADLAGLDVPLLVTDVHEGEWVHRARLPWPCAWVLGHEGQGVSAELSALAVQRLRIAQPGGEESLNVAAAAAICLHASAVARL